MTNASHLFDVTDYAQRAVEGTIERVPLEQIELARNPRRDISSDGIERLAGMLMRTGQLVPAIGRRADDEKVLLYAGQRRLLAAQASAGLAGTDGYEQLKPVVGLIVLLLDYEPTDADIRRIQAQENQREDLSRRDQQEQFRDCWVDRAGLPERDRIAMVCEDLGISAKQAHNLRREISLPDEIRVRVAERPSGGQISVTMATKLADMREVSPELCSAVAERITTTDLHERAQKDLGGFVHRTIVEDERVYAVRIDEGALLDGVEQLELARKHLDSAQTAQVVALLGCKDDEVDKELDVLTSRAKDKALKIRVDGHLRDRATNGQYAWSFERGEDFAAGVWVIDPVFIVALVAEQLEGADASVATEERFFGGAKVDDEDMEEAARADAERRKEEAKRIRDAYQSNLGLGLDIRSGLMEPTDRQLHALKALVCNLLVAHYADVIAFGAGWTDQALQQPVGDTQRYEPRQADAIVNSELQRALEDKDPLRGIANLVARLGAAFMLDQQGVTKTKALGSDRMARKLRDALPGGENPIRDAVWQFMRPMLSPHLVELNQDAFVVDGGVESTVDLDAHRDDSSLDDLDLGAGEEVAA